MSAVVKNIKGGQVVKQAIVSSSSSILLSNIVKLLYCGNKIASEVLQLCILYKDLNV